MIETPFSMKKYIDMLPSKVFEHVGVTIETKTAVTNINHILSEGTSLTDVTIGRSDLSASIDLENADSERIVEMVKKVAHIAKSNGL